MKFTTSLLSASAIAILASALPATVQAAGHNNSPVVIYFTRHAEKKTTTESLGTATTTYELEWTLSTVEGEDDTTTLTPGGINDEEEANVISMSNGSNRNDVCGESKCAEELSDLGLERAELLAEWFQRRGITRRVDAVYSSHKRRTFQTVEQIAKDAGTSVVQLPVGGTELQPESTGPSVCPTIEAITTASPGDTLVVAGHSGTLYDIMGAGKSDCPGLGLTLEDGTPLSTKPGTDILPNICHMFSLL